jgi:hypothetical protein
MMSRVISSGGSAAFDLPLFSPDAEITLGTQVAITIPAPAMALLRRKSRLLSFFSIFSFVLLSFILFS